jgi:hypothetical protein
MKLTISSLFLIASFAADALIGCGSGGTPLPAKPPPEYEAPRGYDGGAAFDEAPAAPADPSP